jgi:hypothetical protein
MYLTLIKKLPQARPVYQLPYCMDIPDDGHMTTKAFTNLVPTTAQKV